MKIKEQQLKGVFEITFDPKSDERGYFMRTCDVKLLSESGLNREWVQENQSVSLKKGIIRGMHFQLDPFAETKWVRCSRGSILDVFVDLRTGSETFGKWNSIELSESNFKSVFIPRGFAHGFCTLADHCTVEYKVDNYYTPSHECCLLWSDPDLDIQWPVTNPIVSVKDARASTFREFVTKYSSVKV